MRDASSHIQACTLCQAKAHICELCGNERDLLYPFQTERVHQVRGCMQRRTSRRAVRSVQGRAAPALLPSPAPGAAASPFRRAHTRSRARAQSASALPATARASSCSGRPSPNPTAPHDTRPPACLPLAPRGSRACTVHIDEPMHINHPRPGCRAPAPAQPGPQSAARPSAAGVNGCGECDRRMPGSAAREPPACGPVAATAAANRSQQLLGAHACLGGRLGAPAQHGVHRKRRGVAAL